MKLLIFAHTPPPHHGQSYMVKLMLDGFGGDQWIKANRVATPSPSIHGIECYHVNARVSKDLEDIGYFQFIKIFLLLGHCLQAIWCRFRFGVKAMYYVPAPGKKSALYRDWIVMFLCRPFFPTMILHWHAAGLGKWLETHVQMPHRTMTYKRLRDVDLSITLSAYNRADADKLMPKRVCVVNNGIPDPCPNFEKDVLPRRVARWKARQAILSGAKPASRECDTAGSHPEVFKVLYLAHCTRDKGLFDTMAGVLLANTRLEATGSPLRIELLVAGGFFNREEELEFEKACKAFQGRSSLRYLGFVSGAQKQAALCEADLFCFPTFFHNENQPVNLNEAMAYGLPILTSRWRSIPELFPPGQGMLVDIQSPEQIADALMEALPLSTGGSLRELLINKFNLDQYLSSLAAAFKSVESHSRTEVRPQPWTPMTKPPTST